MKSGYFTTRIREVVSDFLDDGHVREVAAGTVVAFVLKAFGAIIVFVLNVAIARLLGAEGAGLYFVSFAVIAIASVVSRLGMDNTILRLVASYASEDRWARVSSACSVSIRAVVFTSVVISIVIFLAAPQISNLVFAKPALADPLRIMCLSILPFSLLNLHAEALKGVKKIRDAMVVQGIAYPLIALLLLYPLVGLYAVAGAAAAHTIGVTITAMLGWYAWNARAGKDAEGMDDVPWREVWRSAWPLYKASLVNHAFLPWMPLFMLGIWATSDHVGIFGAANRLAVLVSFLAITVNTVIAPKFAELFVKQQYGTLALVSRRAAVVVLIMASPIIIVMLLMPELIMAVFGEEFTEGAAVLQILALGRLVNLMTGSAGHLLIMSAREDSFARITIASVIGQFILCLLLIPYFGMTGAATATSLALGAQSLALARVVYRKLGIQIIPFLPAHKTPH